MWLKKKSKAPDFDYKALADELESELRGTEDVDVYEIQSTHRNHVKERELEKSQYAEQVFRERLSIIFILFILPLLIVTWSFYEQRNERIECSTLPRHILQQIEDRAIVLPAGCY